MDQEPTKLRQLLHEKGRRQLSIGRMTPETKDPKELKALKREHATLAREIVAIKETLSRIQNA